MTSADPLGEAARRGVQLLLQKALEDEVERFLGRSWYTRSTDGALRRHCNGYEPKRVHLAEGTIELQVPQLREPLEPFESIWLQAIGTRSSRLLQMIPMFYVKGMSQRDIEAALLEALGVEGTGRSVITEVCRTLRADLERWQDRDLSGYRLLALTNCLVKLHIQALNDLFDQQSNDETRLQIGTPVEPLGNIGHDRASSPANSRPFSLER